MRHAVATALVGRDHQLTQVERHLTGTGRAAVLYGPEGVGKTRLAHEVVGRLARRAFDTELVVGTPAAATIPFAALAGLLPASDAPAGDATSVIHACRRELAARTSVTPMVILVDDAHWLDRGSLSLLNHLVALPGVRLLATARSGETIPEEITGLWKDGRALRVDLEPLDRPDTDLLVTQVLGGPPDRVTAVRLWELSCGNPLFLRELLLAARELGHLVEEGRCWRIVEPFPISPRLTDLVSSRLATLDDRARLGLVALSLVEPLDAATFARIVGAAAVADLEGAQTIESVDVGQRRQVRFGHPVYGQVVRATTPHARGAQVAGLLLDDLEGPQASHPTDVGTLANLWAAADRPGRAELFTEAARRAMATADHTSAEELARVAVGRSGDTEARLTYAEALVYRGRSDLAAQILAPEAAGATSDEHIARIALLQVHDALFNQADLAKADAVAREARCRTRDPAWCEQLDATRALTAGLRGDLHAALDASDLVLGHEAAEPRALLGVLTISTIAHAMLGDIAAARGDLARAEPLLEPLQEALPLARDQVRITEVATELHDAQVRTALGLATRGYASAREASGAAPPGAWAATLANASIVAGHLREAERLAAEAGTRFEAADPLGLRGMTLGMRSLCAAGLGDLDAAETWLQRAAEVGVRDLRARIHAERAEVWWTAAQGDLGRACHLARTSGQRTVDATHHVWGAMALHDAVRLGQPGPVRSSLVALAATHDARLLALFADHAVALDDEDADALRSAASRFASAGAELYAAEAVAQAADLLRRQGRGRDAAAAAAVAADLHRAFAEVVTPALIRVDDPLTAREREIVLMARRGMTSRRIAEALVVSPRTVDNHLASIYRKTGIEGRHQLDDLVLGEPRRTG